MTEAKSNGAITFDRIDVRFTHKNDRIELHGEEQKIACDLDFRYETSNDVLAHFSPTLRSDLYMEDPNLDRKKGGKLPGLEEKLSMLKHPAIESIKWKSHEIVGGTLTIHRDPSGKDMVFELANIGKWRLEPKQGGTVSVLFQAQVHPKGKDGGELMNLLQLGLVNISVTPPKAFESTDPAQASIDGTK